MSDYNEGQAIEAAKWQADTDARNDRIDNSAYIGNPFYRHTYDQRVEQRPTPSDDNTPSSWMPTGGTAVVRSGSQSSGSSSSSGESGDGTVFAGIFGVIGLFLALPMIAWALGVLASRVLPWGNAILEIGHLTAWFGPNGWLVAALFVAALLGQWIVAVAAMRGSQDVAVAFLIAAVTLFATTEAVKAVLIFAHAPDFQCHQTFSWIAQACSADVWSFAKTVMSWTGLASMTGLAAWAVTVVTAIIYVAIGTLLQALVLAPALAIMDWLD